MPTLSIKLPYNVSDIYGIDMISDLKTMAKQGLKSIILTNPGEQIFSIDYGVGIDSLLFSNTDDGSIEKIREKIFLQTKKYLPFISLTKCEISRNLNKVYFKLTYFINSSKTFDTLEMDIETNVR